MNLQELRDNYREDILRIAAKYGLTNVRVFGSVARGEATENSDVDLLVTATKPLGFAYAGAEREFSESLRLPVQLIADDALHPALQARVLEESQQL